MRPDDFLLRIASFLRDSGIPFMLTGSVASSVHGEPRATNDFDLIIDPTPAQLVEFVKLAGESYYVSPEAAEQAMRTRGMFNVIAPEEGLKADLILLRGREFEKTAFARRVSELNFSPEIPLISVEDSILSKLDWSRESESERQYRDVVGIAAAQWGKLDFEYLRHWAKMLKLSDELEEALRDADELRPR